jgi:hypothetical protein
MCFEKLRYDIHGFRLCYRTNGIDKSASFVYGGCRAVHDLLLYGDEFHYAVCVRTPAHIRITGPCSDAGAGCIDKHAVKMCLFRHFMPGVQALEVNNIAVVSLQSLLELGQHAGAVIRGCNPSLMLDGVSKVQGFAAGTGTHIPPALSGLRLCYMCHALRCQVLDFDRASSFFAQPWQMERFTQKKGRIQALGECSPVAGGCKAFG